MQQKNFFSVALLCSVFWHLLWVQTVNIIWPVKSSGNKFTEINFWGNIADSQTGNFANLRVDKNDGFWAQGLEYAKDSLANIDGVGKKTLPLTQFSNKISVAEQQGSNGLHGGETNIANKQIQEMKRKVIYKPSLPAYPEWAKKIDTNFEIELNVLILPDGSVGGVEKFSTCGYPELEELGVRFIRKWKFVPLPKDVSQQPQWGMIKLFFKAQ